ncbi:RNA-binding protein [Pedobacter sp. KBW06]|uniref:RNA recognition motif domain-containing protein n=1 Tax=Pedobacter sp. KBW06 TaxID=2153359 RepID=UPI000F599F9D|nr:RNA-binding protein [Pedobacter sp. KBW06]RQO65283.1 RNA-binding protein [Pedobacter sp. KBW06]
MEKLFVGGFPPEIHEVQLAELFSLHGEVSTVKFIYDRATKKCKGYGFIEMSSTEVAENAVSALNGTLLAGRELSVRIASKEKSSEEESPARSSPKEYLKVERNSQPAKKRQRRPRL